MEKHIFIFILTLGILNLYGQNIKVGIRLEPYFFVDGHISNHIVVRKLEDGTGIFLKSCSIDIEKDTFLDFSNSIRIGYLESRTTGNHGYNGFEVSTYMYYGKKQKSISPLLGLVLHFNNGSNTYGVIVNKKSILLGSIGIEKKIVDKFIIGSIIQFPLTNSEFSKVLTNIPQTTFVKYIIKFVAGYEISL
jgi:hypothetical protein